MFDNSIMLILVVLGAIVVFIYQSKRPVWVIFYPVYENEQQEYYTERSYSEDFLKRLIKVLEFYNIPFKLESGQLLVTKSTYDNQELMHNYTKKVNDEAWLKAQGLLV